MPKQKTNKSAKKRLKLTARGKIKRLHPGAGHLKSRKSPSQRRRFRRQDDIPKVFMKTVKKLLGVS
jgi:large subunit ribosomal protein L35